MKTPLLVVTLVLATAAAAKSVTFTLPPEYRSVDGHSQDGFTLRGNWYTYDSVPFMEYWDTGHSIVFDAGTFTFQNMALSGWPWDEFGSYGVSEGGLLRFEFKDLSGNTLDAGEITLRGDNSWRHYTRLVPGVHEIQFLPTGSVDPYQRGFWPRLAVINEEFEFEMQEIEDRVPEAGSAVGLLGTAFAVFGVLRRVTLRAPSRL